MKRRIIFIFMFVLASLTLVACSQDSGASLDELKEALALEKTENIREDFLLPRYIGEADAKGKYNHSLTWQSSNEYVISIGDLNEEGSHYHASVHAVTKAETIQLIATITLKKGGSDKKILIVKVVPPVDGLLSTTEAKKAKDDSNIAISGVVSYTNDQGFFVEDEAGAMYVFLQETHTYKAGDFVNVSGIKGTYNYMPQFTNKPSKPSITVESSGAYSGKPVSMTYADVKAKKTTDVDFFGKMIRLEGLLEKNTSSDANSVYTLTDLVSGDFVGINKYTITKAQNQLKDKVGSFVSLDLIVYDYTKVGSNEYWRFLYMEDTLVEKDAPEIGDQEKIDNTKEALLKDFDELTINASITLPVTNIFGVTIAWSSDNEAISNTGVYTAPTVEDAIVTLTAVIKSGALSETITLKITAKKVAEEGELHVVINEIYGGGGNSGATLKNDFIELYNPTDEDIDLTGWSIQYGSATGDFRTENSRELSGVIKAHSYFLIQAAAQGGGTVDLPTPDFVTDLALGGTAGKVALANTTDQVISPTDIHVVDFVGYGTTAHKYEGSGPTANLSNTTSASRVNFLDTNDNKNDFVIGAPTPQNSSSE